MGWHIHTKKGKFNIWSTVVDEYLLLNWVDEATIRDVYVNLRLQEEKKRINDDIEEVVKNAKESGFCGLSYMRCEPKTFNYILRLNQKRKLKVRV